MLSYGGVNVRLRDQDHGEERAGYGQEFLDDRVPGSVRGARVGELVDDSWEVQVQEVVAECEIVGIGDCR